MSAVVAAPGTHATRFELVSHWHIAAPIDAVWAALKAAEQWPRWWRYVKRVDELRAGDADGLGAIRHFQWSSRLPYGVAFDVEVVEVHAPRLMRGRARGQLVGEGVWELIPEGDTTRVRYTWCVDLNHRWMRWIAPLAAPVFRWNHDGVMRAGAHGLAQHLDARLLDAY